MKRIVKVVGGLLLLGLIIWWIYLPPNLRYHHCTRYTKWFLIQPFQNDLGAPLWKWQITSCYLSADACNSYRLKRIKEWNEDLRKEPALDKQMSEYDAQISTQYAAARCMSVDDKEIKEAVRQHGPIWSPVWGAEETGDD
jgi:hypothetical protein